MSIQAQVLESAVRICRARGGWRFRASEIVDALPHLSPGSVRTHIMSRCCVNAPVNHVHRWPYFRRVGRGTYEVLPPVRKLRGLAVAEARASYVAGLSVDDDPVLARYARDIDRTLIRATLRLSVEQRLRNLASWMKAVSELQEAGRRAMRKKRR